MIAGLIRTDESDSSTGIPGLSDLPILGHIFGHKANDRSRTDLILTLTPHIVRQAEITELDLLPIWVGTEANITFRGDSPRLESEVSNGPFDESQGTPEEIQEMMRRRLEQLPRGLREGDSPPVQEPPPPRGTDLVPAPRDNFFDDPVEPDPERFEPPPPEQFDLEPPTGAASRDDDVPPFVSPELLAEAIALASDRQRAERVAAAGGSAAVEREAAPVVESVGASAATGEAAARVWLVPRRATVEPGESFEVLLQASAVRPLAHLPLLLEFDPAVVVVEQVVAGDFLGGTGEVQVLSDTSTPGRLVLGASRLGQSGGARGAGTVARIRFRALAAGDTRVRFAEARALDPLLQPLAPFTAEVMEIEVGPRPATTPRGPEVERVETEAEPRRPRS